MDQKLITTGYSSKLCMFPFNSDTGEIDDTLIKVQEIDSNATFGAYHENSKSLIFCHEVGSYGENIKNSGGVSRMIMNPNEEWQRKQMLPSFGEDPAHIVLDSNKGLVFVTNYSGGSLSVYQINQQEIIENPIYKEKITSPGSGVVVDRQEAPHLHGAFIYKNFFYVVDLGSDKIFHYKVNENSNGFKINKSEPSETCMDGGSGPRHMSIHHNLDYAFILNELETTITIMKINPINGSLNKQNKISIDLSNLSKNKNDNVTQYGSEIEIHPNGKYLYISNRGHGGIIGFEIKNENEKINLIQIQEISTGGTWPRHFTITKNGKFLIVADQFKEELVTFVIDINTGKLSFKSTIKSPNNPSMVQII